MPKTSALRKRAVTHDQAEVAGSPAALTRGEVAGLMRLSVTTVRRLEGRELHPRRSPEGVYLFDPREVEQARARRPPPSEPTESREPGDLAAETFRLLRDGVNIRDIVIALRRPPAEIEALHADWARMGDTFVISSDVHSQLARMASHGLLSDEILDAVEDDDAEALCLLVSDAISELDER
jgi:hypothetical protein